MKTFTIVHTLAALTLVIFSACSSADDQLKKKVEEVNKFYPKMIDEITRLDSLSCSPGAHLYYHYTWVDMSMIENFTPDQMTELTYQLKHKLLGAAKSDNPNIKRFRDSKVTFHNIYRNADGEFISEVVVTPEEYK